MTTPATRADNPRRIRHQPGETREDRFRRYAHNAGITAAAAEERAAEQHRAAWLHHLAAVNAARHDDMRAADLYDEMARAAEDAAEAIEDIIRLARQVTRHYARQEN